MNRRGNENRRGQNCRGAGKQGGKCNGLGVGRKQKVAETGRGTRCGLGRQAGLCRAGASVNISQVDMEIKRT